LRRDALASYTYAKAKLRNILELFRGVYVPGKICVRDGSQYLPWPSVFGSNRTQNRVKKGAGS
jgi:hypothetical protein